MNNILKVIILIIVAIFIAFDVLFYNFCEKQKNELSSMKDKLDVEAEFNSNKFKYQQDQIERIGKDLEDSEQQIKDQKDQLSAQNDAFLQEVAKRQQVENENKAVQTSLIDIKAEADAIKQDMKGWQKDYVSVLAELEKKMDDSQAETKNFENGLTALNIPELKENINSLKAEIQKMIPPPPVNNVPDPLTTPDKDVTTTNSQSQQQ